MIVFEIRYPGSWLDLPDHDRAWTLGRLFDLLNNQATDAIVALNQFLLTQAAGHTTWNQEWEADAVQRDLIEMEVRTSFGDRISYEHCEAIREEVDRRIKRTKWGSGRIPRDYRDRLPFIYAHAFLYAVTSFGNILSKLSEEADTPALVQTKFADFRNAFPEVRDIRNSAQHIEDRGRALDKKGMPLDLQPVENSIARAPGGGVLMLTNIANDRLGYTTAAGTYAEIAISVDSAKIVVEVFQSILNAFSWKGPPRILPD